MTFGSDLKVIGFKKIQGFFVVVLPLAAVCFWAFAMPVFAVDSMPKLTASAARIVGDKARTRIVIDFDVQPKVSVHYLENPNRIIVDLDETDFAFPEDQLKPTGLYKDIRFGTMAPGSSRIVLTLNRTSQLVTAEAQKDETGPGYHLVLDGEVLPDSKFAEIVKTQDWQRVNSDASKGDRIGSKTEAKNTVFVIAVDAGHGGIDTGATGIDSKTQEKDITLDYAKSLVDLLNAEAGVHAFLTRETDVFLSLQERVMIARQQNANLFISIHADTLPQKDIRGATVYTISDRASDNLAENLASRENKSDDIAGVPLADEPAEVADILIDLARRETQAFSITLADTIVKSFEGEINLINNPHRSAGFRVLMAPDVPSVLVELGFLSNKDDEAQLIDPDFRNKVAKRLTDAIRKYRENQGKNG